MRTLAFLAHAAVIAGALAVPGALAAGMRTFAWSSCLANSHFLVCYLIYCNYFIYTATILFILQLFFLYCNYLLYGIFTTVAFNFSAPSVCISGVFYVTT